MLVKALALFCLSTAYRDIRSKSTYSTKEKVSSDIDKQERLIPRHIPIIFDNGGTWTRDFCTYDEQADGSILINTMHPYQNNGVCHEYWECKNTDHNMFFKWNKVQIVESSDCYSDWARFAWGTAEDQQEILCSENDDLSYRETTYRNTGSNKIVWNFQSNYAHTNWGVQAQILCKDPSSVNECIDGTHNCSEGADCINEPGKSGYMCQCQSNGIKWGDQRLSFIGSGTISDPCYAFHPDNSIKVFPIKWNGETVGVIYEESNGNETYQRWENALQRCNELGMTLPLPTNGDSNEALKEFAVASNRIRPRGHKGIFLGTYKNNEGQWVNAYTDEVIAYNQLPFNDGYYYYYWYGDDDLKVAEMRIYSGGWTPTKLIDDDSHDLICIKVDYKDLDSHVKFCDTGLHLCHVTSNCVEYAEINSTTNSSYIDYTCNCDLLTVKDIELTPLNSIVGKGEICKYTLPPYNVEVDVFTYDGEPTVYHYHETRDNYEEALRHCAKLGMHLPIPNTEQQFEDLRTISGSTPNRTDSVWLGYSDSDTEGTWLNVYNGEQLAIDKWENGAPSSNTNYNNVEMKQYGSIELNDIPTTSAWYRGTLCVKTGIQNNIDFCEKNLHDCSSGATCIKAGNSYTCICSSAQIGDLYLEPAATSTGIGLNGCHYIHSNADGNRVYKFNYGGRDSVVYIGDAAGKKLSDYALKCSSLGMKMLTPNNTEEAAAILQLKPFVDTNTRIPLGITRRYDSVAWRNIYTDDGGDYIGHDLPIWWASLTAPGDFAYANVQNSEWKLTDFNSFDSAWKTVCISAQDGEATEVDFCGTDFNDCYKGFTCINGGDSGYTCEPECQPLQFGDIAIAPASGNGKNCTYPMPGHDDKTLFPVRVWDNDTNDHKFYAFHAFRNNLTLVDAMIYCGKLGMNLPIPNDIHEFAAMIDVLPGLYWNTSYTGIYAFWLGIGFNRDNSKTHGFTYSNAYDDQTVCQKDTRIDISKLDWCAAGLHNCHVDANCLLSDDKNELTRCECKESNFYTGNGIGENGCSKSNFVIDHYKVDVRINDRYARTQIAVSVTNKDYNRDKLYEFGVNLDQSEFISGLSMRMGDNGTVFIGDVRKELEAEEIFNDAVGSGDGSNDAITTTETTVKRNTTFATKVNVPAGEKLYIWLDYDKQLTREKGLYAYSTNIFPYDQVSKMSVAVTIEELNNIDIKKTEVYWESELPGNRTNGWRLKKFDSKKWQYSFEKESIDMQEWNDNLKIEYDLERSNNTCGDIVMRDGYFIHHIAPESIGSIPKNVILAVDTSGSMNMTRMNNSITAITAILNTLTEQDTFWLQQFNSSVSSWTPDAVLASAENLKNAKRWVRSLHAGGGTDLYSGLFNSVQRPIDHNRANIAFIISDGYPTIGLTNWADIQANILAANSVKNSQGKEIGQKWAIFNFGIGHGAAMFELNKLSTWNMGVGRQVFDDADIFAQLKSFFDEYSNPLIWNNHFHYSGAIEYDCSATNLFADQELTCIGKLHLSKQCGDIDDLGFSPGSTLLAGINLMDVSNVRVVKACYESS